jgi:inhibitor of cysteine peptidase
MKHIIPVILGITCIIAVAFSGCTGTGPVNPTNKTPTPSPQETAIQVGNIVVNEQQNGATTSLNLSRTVTLRLKENPSTGYTWNLTMTPGLQVTSDTFYPSDSSGSLVGAGGTREWTIKTIQYGEQKIQANYKRSWEPVAGNETTFSMTILVSPS